MAEAKKNRIPTAYSPKGVAVFPRLNEPDFKFKDAGQYSTKLRLPKAEAEAFLAKFQSLSDDIHAEKVEFFKGKKDKKGKMIEVENAGLPFSVETDKEGNETGFILLAFSSNASFKDKTTGVEKKITPGIYDSQGKPANVQVGGGSVLKVAFQPFPYYNDATQKSGVSFRLQGVQVIELRQFGSNLDFGVEEGGFVAESAPAFPVEAADGVPSKSAGSF